jgi:hypothetical protein
MTGTPFFTGDSVAAFNEVPIFWTTTQAGYNDADRTRRYMRNGKRVVEKLPQSGHVGGYDERRPAKGTRYARVIDSAGNEIALVMTNGAAHLDAGTGYGQMMRSKARALGWFGITECPCALVAAKDINREAFLVDEIRDGTARACQSGSYKGDHLETMCPHAKAEREARIAAHSAHEAERAEKLRSRDDKLVEQQGKMLEYLANAAVTGKLPMVEETAPEQRTRRKKDDAE